MLWRMRFFTRLLLLCLITPLLGAAIAAAQTSPVLELSRPVRPWEFLSAVGTRAGLFGNEAGQFEAWVYPLKILRGFHLRFLSGGRVLPAEALARTVTVRPESSSILYSSDTFSVRETWFAPVHEPGAVIRLDIETAEPLEVEAAFERDFTLEWPAALGGTYVNWNPALHAFLFGEEQKKYAAFVGSPSAAEYREEFFSNYASSTENSFRLGVTAKGRDSKTIVIAASTQGQADAEHVYEQLATDYDKLLAASADYYRAYLDHTLSLELPEPQLEQAYDWSRIGMLQGVVSNPSLGTGLIAGYRTSGESQRPGFAWFFGRDALWTSLALDAEGDFATTRTALEFLSKYQRADGKITHEISQSAGLVPWFKDYLYAYASADATPLFIIATNDYVVRSGDVNFAKSQWDNLWRAYQFLHSTYDAQGVPQNLGIGHGWVEGGPLLPLKAEIYQSGLGAEALRALGNLAHLTSKEDVRQQLGQEFSQLQTLINQTFWSPEKKAFAFALDQNDRRMEILSVLTAVPMWFGLLDDEKAQGTIDQLADYDHQTDWGTRIISSSDVHYNPGGYHFGAVWPLFTGWASVGEYRYHRAFPGYLNLRSNSLLALDGSLGHVTEVLSGDYYQPLSTSSPHQIWSAAMVVSPFLTGMLGLESDAVTCHIRFAPHLPADWTHLKVNNFRVGEARFDLIYEKASDSITLQVLQTGGESCQVEFAPAVGLRADVLGAELDGRAWKVHAQTNSQDQHPDAQFASRNGSHVLRIRLRNNFEASVSSTLPPLGSGSRGLRILSQTWSARRDSLSLELSGVPGSEYKLALWNPEPITSVEGGAVVKSQAGAELYVKFPATSASYTHAQITFHFADQRAAHQGAINK